MDDDEVVLRPADDGRVTAARHGRAGPVVLVCDGYGSRLVAHLLCDAADATPFRVLAPDRPGFRGTTGAVGDRAAWSQRLPAVLDAAGVTADDALVVLGTSAGTAVAVRIAADHPDRVSRLVLVGPMPPVAETGLPPGMLRGMRRSFALSMRWPAVGRLLNRGIAAVSRIRPAVAAAANARQRPPDDRRRFDEPALRRLVELLAPDLPGDRGRPAAAELDELVRARWGEDARRVAVATTVWTAAGDGVHPPAGGAWLAEMIPGAELHATDAPGFLSLLDRVAPTLGA